jgi:hypothetical protein
MATIDRAEATRKANAKAEAEKAAAAKAAADKAAADAAAKKKSSGTSSGSGLATQAGALLPGEVSGTPDVKSAEQLLQKNYAGQWAFWHQEDTTDANGKVVVGGLAKFLDSMLADGTIAAASTGNKAAVERFNMGLQATDWYKANGAQALTAATVKYSQPTTWQESISNRQTAISNMATQLGYKLSPDTLNSLTEASLYQAYDGTYFNSNDQQLKLQAKITQAARAEKLGATSGAALTNAQTLKTYVQDMGGGFSDQWVSNAVNDINDPTTQTDINTYKDMVKQRAMSAYSGFSGLIDKGVTVKQIADPYVQSMANILEVDPAAIDYTKDASIKKALGTTMNADGTSSPMPIWQYEQSLKQDPRWAFTNNAREDVNGMLHQIGRDFGFVS